MFYLERCIKGYLKGAYKVVYKGLDREEGYEVAWNCNFTILLSKKHVKLQN